MVPTVTAVARTIWFEEAASRRWDALVIGSGPAGSAAARRLALGGRRVLLVDRASFPRWKVCGCCLSQAGINALREIGLADLPTWHRAPALRWLSLACGRARAVLPMSGVSLSREALDSALLTAAIEAGAAFLHRATAIGTDLNGDSRTVTLRDSAGRGHHLRAALVFASDGLATALAPELGRVTWRRSRIGLGAVVDQHAGDDAVPPPNTVTMMVGRTGYVGAVALEDGRINIAAAVAPGALRRARSPAAAIGALFRSANLPRPRGLDS